MVDECSLGVSNCDPNANCVDLEMGFECVCLPGYTGDGLSCSGESLLCVCLLSLLWIAWYKAY